MTEKTTTFTPYKPKKVSTWADIEKEIEKEYSWLTYDGMKKENARKKATETVHEKFSDVVANLQKPE